MSMYKVKQWILISDYSILKNAITNEEKRIGTHDFLVLRLLCENAGHIVHKKELLEYAWPGRHVSEGSITQAISNIRNVIDDNGKDQKHLKTITKVGYKLDSCIVEKTNETIAVATSIDTFVDNLEEALDPKVQESNIPNVVNRPLKIKLKVIFTQYNWLYSWQFLMGLACIIIAFTFPLIKKHNIINNGAIPSIVPEKITNTPQLIVFWDNKEQGTVITQQLTPYLEALGNNLSIRLMVMRTEDTLSLIIIKGSVKPINIIFLLNKKDDTRSIITLIKDEIQVHAH